MERLIRESLDIHTNVAAFLEDIEEDDRKRAALIKRLAPSMKLGPAYEKTVDGLDFQTDDGATEQIGEDESPEDLLIAPVIRHYISSDINVSLYPLLEQVATHLREVAIGMADPNWKLIRHAYIRKVDLEKWTHAARGRNAANLPDSEKDKLLRHIGALAIALSEKSKKYVRGDKPNGLRIAEAVSEILEDIPDVKKHGLGSSNLRQSIKEGIAALTKA